jgi:hypothetical protein
MMFNEINYDLQVIADNLKMELVNEQYNEMVQAIMAGFYEAVDEACEFDRIVDLAV